MQYLKRTCFLFVLNSFLSKVSANVKVKEMEGCVPLDSVGTRSCVAVCALQSVRGTSPSTPTPACVSVGRVRSRVWDKARGSTPTPAGRHEQQKGQVFDKVSMNKIGISLWLLQTILGTYFPYRLHLSHWCQGLYFPSVSMSMTHSSCIRWSGFHIASEQFIQVISSSFGTSTVRWNINMWPNVNQSSWNLTAALHFQSNHKTVTAHCPNTTWLRPHSQLLIKRLECQYVR